MAFYMVDVRDQVIQRVSREHNHVNNARYLLIEAGSATQAWAKASGASAEDHAAPCADCRHRHCKTCAECSVAKEYSDYWICHCCGSLNLRVQKLV